MNGKVIVIEGTDGSGKQTQAKILLDNLNALGSKAIGVSFPNYESDSSAPVRMYLNGELGSDPSRLNPHAISTMYAIDRYITYEKYIKDFYLDNYIVVEDRYTTSNIVHQASKIHDKDDKDEFINWVENLEYEKMKLPRPDIVILLNMPVDKSIEITKERDNKITHEFKKDIHEDSIEFLTASYNNAMYVAHTLGWFIVDCTDGNIIKSREQVAEEINTILRDNII